MERQARNDDDDDNDDDGDDDLSEVCEEKALGGEGGMEPGIKMDAGAIPAKHHNNNDYDDDDDTATLKLLGVFKPFFKPFFSQFQQFQNYFCTLFSRRFSFLIVKPLIAVLDESNSYVSCCACVIQQVAVLDDLHFYVF